MLCYILAKFVHVLFILLVANSIHGSHLLLHVRWVILEQLLLAYIVRILLILFICRISLLLVVLILCLCCQIYTWCFNVKFILVLFLYLYFYFILNLTMFIIVDTHQFFKTLLWCALVNFSYVLYWTMLRLVFLCTFCVCQYFPVSNSPLDYTIVILEFEYSCSF